MCLCIGMHAAWGQGIYNAVLGTLAPNLLEKDSFMGEGIQYLGTWVGRYPLCCG